MALNCPRFTPVYPRTNCAKRKAMAWRQKVLFVLLLLGSAFAMSCVLLKSDIDKVRDGVLADHNTTTVGKAFEGTFQKGKWSSFVSSKGEKVVQFDGTTSYGELNDALFIWDRTDYPLDRLESSCVSSLGLTETVAQIKQQAQNGARKYFEDHSPGGSLASWEIPTKADQLEREMMEGGPRQQIDQCVRDTRVSVWLQFLLSADGKTFELGHVDKVFGSPERALSLVYR